ncbi:MAG: diaminopimelate decarboxylase [Candidatus Diapherotrites archaeon CG11_big_fil_rev_8_21_14_0_20_37_9]|nr:MAG: diaminopimelate decarboxylase [Candidatus Diapherotrites archaeon CG11_big_fil_rev_8_21_14_0_20_37_9]
MNNDNDLHFTKEQIEKITETYSTPFHIYAEEGIRQNAKNLKTAFSSFNGFKNYFAVKACPNPYILEILKEEGMGVDCSSLPELLLAEASGFKGEEIMFTSNNTPANEFQKAAELGAIINLDDITHIPFIEEHIRIPELICFRYNPGPLRKTSEGNVIGNPEDAKYGLTRDQIFEAYKTMRDKGSKRFGLHTMVASNDLNPETFKETASMLFGLAIEIFEKLGIKIEFINLGGGIGIPYKPEQKEINLVELAEKIKAVIDEKKVFEKLPGLKIVMENGRMITGPFGYLITRAIHEKHIYKGYIGVDASMANLMRPGMYGAYHHITVLGKENAMATKTYSIVGSLCENNDMFAIQRKFPEIKIGDLLAIHNAGAHGHAMGFNYNGKLRSAELLLRKNGEVKLIRRAETEKDYFLTLDFPDSEYSGLSRD